MGMALNEDLIKGKTDIAYVYTDGTDRPAFVTNVVDLQNGIINLVYFNDVNDNVTPPITAVGNVQKDNVTKNPGTWHFRDE